jgi:hypothetical protein
VGGHWKAQNAYLSAFLTDWQVSWLGVDLSPLRPSTDEISTARQKLSDDYIVIRSLICASSRQLGNGITFGK